MDGIIYTMAVCMFFLCVLVIVKIARRCQKQSVVPSSKVDMEQERITIII